MKKPNNKTNAEKIADIYNKTPEAKRPLLTALIAAFLAGMETQELLSEDDEPDGR